MANDSTVADEFAYRPLDADVIRAFIDDDRFYALDIDDRYVLFRIDGMVHRISPIAFSLLNASADGASPETRLQQALDRYGREPVSECMSGLASMRDLLKVGQPDATPDYIPLDRIRRKSLAGILIMVTQTCNLACVYCYAGGGSYGQPTKFQTEQHALEALDYLFTKSEGRQLLRVTFFGGEPLLNFPVIRRIVDYCEAAKAQHGKTIEYTITTNATMVTDEVARFMREKRFSVMVSFDGTRSIHDKYRPLLNGAGSFDKVRHGIATLVNAGIPVQLRGTVVKEMVDQKLFDDAIDEAKALGVQGISLSPVDCLRSPTKEYELDMGDGDRLGSIHDTITKRNIAEAQDGSESFLYDPHASTLKALLQGKAVGKGRCGACNAMSALSTDGRFYPCHRFVGMDDYVLGSLAEGGIDDAKVDQFFQRAAAATTPKCSVCMARLICGGFCFFTVADGKGGFQPPTEEACDGYRRGLKRTLGYLLTLQELPREQATSYLRRLSHGG